MAMTFDQAIVALNDPTYQNLDGLKKLVSQISVEIPGQQPGARTLLYSGNIGDLPAWKLAEDMAKAARRKTGSVLTFQHFIQNPFPIFEQLDSPSCSAQKTARRFRPWCRRRIDRLCTWLHRGRRSASGIR